MSLNIPAASLELIVSLLGKRNIKKIKFLKNWILSFADQKNIDLVDRGAARRHVITSG